MFKQKIVEDLKLVFQHMGNLVMNQWYFSMGRVDFIGGKKLYHSGKNMKDIGKNYIPSRSRIVNFFENLHGSEM